MSLKVDYKQKTALMFHMPAIVLLTLITMVPLIYNIRISFYDFSLTRAGNRDIFVGLENYKMILSDHEFWNSMWVTAKFVITSTFIHLCWDRCFSGAYSTI